MIEATMNFKLRNETWVDKGETIKPKNDAEKEYLLSSGLAVVSKRKTKKKVNPFSNDK